MCEESTTSNNCEKIKGVDTCLCGRGLQCDDSKPKCVDYYGNSDPNDWTLTCKPGNTTQIIPKFKHSKSFNFLLSFLPLTI